jgi:hypothetical protein
MIIFSIKNKTPMFVSMQVFEEQESQQGNINTSIMLWKISVKRKRGFNLGQVDRELLTDNGNIVFGSSCCSIPLVLFSFIDRCRSLLILSIILFGKQSKNLQNYRYPNNSADMWKLDSGQNTLSTRRVITTKSVQPVLLLEASRQSDSPTFRIELMRMFLV